MWIFQYIFLDSSHPLFTFLVWSNVNNFITQTAATCIPTFLIMINVFVYRKLPLISPSGYRPTYMQTKKIHPIISLSGCKPPSSFSCFINFKHSQRTRLLQQINTLNVTNKYEKLLCCELDIKTLTNDGGDEL